MRNIFIDKSSYFLFSGGEAHIKLNPNDMAAGYNDGARLILLDYSSDGIMAMLHAAEVLHRNEVPRLALVMPYLPYARQDRVMERNEPFSLLVFASIINNCMFDSVTVYDPHSDVGPALINRCKVVPQWEIASIVCQHLLDDSEVVVVSPDAGAYKKVSKLVPDDNRIVIASKHRDFSGKITATHVEDGGRCAGRVCLIVDDICDGGRTFVALGEELKKRGATKVILYVTHGIFSQGYQNLWGGAVDEILTTDTIRRVNEPEGYLAAYPLIRRKYAC